MGSHLKRPRKQIRCRCIKHQNCQLSTWPKAEMLRFLSSVSPPSIYRSSSWCIGSIWIRLLDFLYPLLDPSHSRPWLSKGSWIHPELGFISSGIGGLVTKKAGCLLHSHRKTCLKNFLISVSVAIQNKVLKKKKNAPWNIINNIWRVKITRMNHKIIKLENRWCYIEYLLCARHCANRYV